MPLMRTLNCHTVDTGRPREKRSLVIKASGKADAAFTELVRRMQLSRRNRTFEALICNALVAHGVRLEDAMFDLRRRK